MVAVVRLVLAGFLCCLPAMAAVAGTLQETRDRGYVTCGVSQGLPGFSIRDSFGRWTGLDVDTCRAVAAAVLGDAEKVVFTELTPKERFTALQSGDVDVLARNTTWTLVRDTALGLNFAGVTFFDGQGFMVRADLGLQSARELDGAAVCVSLGTTTELNLSDYFRANGLSLRSVQFENPRDAAAAYERGKCDAMTYDRSALAAFRTEFRDPAAHTILPDIISKEPLGPVVRHGDDEWLDVVKWTVFAKIQAEESGISSQNVEVMKGSKDPIVQRLLGVAGNMGLQLGLSVDWAEQIIRQVGNYGEVYDRNIGPNTPLAIERGMNALWQDGGLHYAMPFR